MARRQDRKVIKIEAAYGSDRQTFIVKRNYDLHVSDVQEDAAKVFKMPVDQLVLYWKVRLVVRAAGESNDRAVFVPGSKYLWYTEWTPRKHGYWKQSSDACLSRRWSRSTESTPRTPRSSSVRSSLLLSQWSLQTTATSTDVSSIRTTRLFGNARPTAAAAAARIRCFSTVWRKDRSVCVSESENSRVQYD